jgi:beta-galactosidase
MKYQPVTKVHHFLHGADYNPEQWKNNPEIIDEDIRLMKLAGCNVMSLGIFSWVSLEPEEGVYTLEWLDEIIDRLYENDIYVILATPSGARPAWLAKKYTEVLRTNEYGRKMKFGGRHNHCLTSPIYRQKVHEINTLLATRYIDHPGIIMWHVSNEYGGECHCELCQNAFRAFLKDKYRTLENLNEQYWSTFWSHTYTNWEQIESPSKIGETEVHGLSIDWRRFVTKQTISFYENE